VVISKADIDNYRDTLRGIASDASSVVSDELRYTNGLKVWQARDAAADAISEAVGTHGDRAQALAGQLFDEVCVGEGINATADLFDGLIDFDKMESEIYFFARNLVEGNRDGFVQQCSELAGFYMMRSAYENTMRNCHQHNMRYARIPTGPETCPWCLMLASRGFVYYTEHDAMAGCHRHCDCVAVPGRGGYSFNDATQVEGYDPDAYYQLWRESGFMPPKTNPMRPDGTYQRMVYNEDAGSKSNPRKRSNRGVRKLIESRHSMPSAEMNELIRRLNAAKDADELGEIYRDIIGDMLRSHQTILDGDWEEISGHYYYTLKELESGKRTNSDPGFEVLSPKHADAKRKKKRR